MQDRFETDRRNFLATAMATAGTALTVGLGITEAEGQTSKTRSHLSDAPPISFNNLYNTSVLATNLEGEAANRLALRRLVDAWAHCADRRLAEQQSNLFLPGGLLLNYEGDPKTYDVHSTIRGRAAIRAALAVLNTFTVTLHMNGQSEVMIQGEHAIGETYCLVHQFLLEKSERKCQTLGIRYYDLFVRQDDRWYFGERAVIIDWTDSRVSTP